MDFFCNLWTNHQAEVIQFGKMIVLVILVLIVAWIVAKIAKRGIKRAILKVPTMDEAVANAIYSAVRVLIWLVAFLIILDLFGVNTASILTVLGAAGLAIGLTLVLVHIVCIPITGTSVNPARSIGPALFEGGLALKQLWVFILAPMVGAAFAAGTWRCLSTECKCCKKE